jgi:hypothetical protein
MGYCMICEQDDTTAPLLRRAALPTCKCPLNQNLQPIQLAAFVVRLIHCHARVRRCASTRVTLGSVILSITDSTGVDRSLSVIPRRSLVLI